MIAVATEKYMTVAEVAAMFDKEESTIKFWIREGRLDRVKAGGSTLIPESAIAKMLGAE